ncbi:hypothetical protein BJF87_13645 [Gordonia sp. CNJ-863]|nr:hypothetical protein BJF87_13645 [Gordonia sp. CNJ-863]
MVEMTYREFDDRAGVVTGFLSANGIGEGSRVVVHMARGVALFPVLLGVMRAGAAFVPVDTSTPRDRVHRIVRDSRAALIVIDDDGADDDVPAGSRVVTLDEMLLGGRKVPPVPDTERAAYVIYTSGTTGDPKGVVVGTEGMHRYLQWARSAYSMDVGSGAPLFTAIGFDATLTTLFGPLLAGKTIQVMDSDEPVLQLAEVLRDSPDFSFLKATPHHVRLLSELLEGDRLTTATRYLVVGGDDLDTPTVQRWMSICPVPVVNEYGPTETVVGCSTFVVRPEGVAQLGAKVPIGRGIAGASLHVLDAEGMPVRSGEIGELYVSGPSADNVYLNRAGATALRFLPDPFGAPGTRMYRTGDLASVRPDAVVEFHGRADRQVKVRGFRVELGEIEAAVRSVAGVVDAAAFAEQKKGEVITTVVFTGAAAPTAVREELVDRVPAWVVPHRIVHADVLPTTTNAKADVAALSALASVSASPQDADSLTVAVIAEFAAVLPAEGITADSDFYAMGGDSMSCIRLVARLRRQGYDVSPSDLPAHPTSSALAALIGERASRATSSPDIQPGQEVEPTPAQRDFFSLRLPDPSHWNQVTVITVPAGVDSERLSRAVSTIATRYDTLHYRFVGGRQLYVGERPAVDVRDVAVADQAELEGAIREANMGLDVENGPLLRVVVARRSQGSDSIILAAHHLIIDEVSWHVLLDDLVVAYLDDTATVHVPTSGFAQWRADLERFAERSEVRARRKYWDALLARPAGCLPSGHLRDDYADEHYWRDGLDGEATAELRDTAAAAKVGVHEVLLGVLVHAVTSAFGIEPPRVDVESHGRLEIEGGIDPSRVIGWCTAVFPVVLEGESIVDFVRSARATLRAQPWDGVEFGLLRESEDSPSRSAEVLFNFLGERERVLDERLGWMFGDVPAGVQSPASGRRPYAIEFQSRLLDGEIRWELRSGARHSAEVSRALSNQIRAGLLIATESLSEDAGFRFPDSGLSAAEVSSVISLLSGSEGDRE